MVSNDIPVVLVGMLVFLLDEAIITGLRCAYESFTWGSASPYG
jgi:hypothetical protein